jgi:hypothetical protein
MGKVKITMGYPSAAAQQGYEIEAGDVIEVDEVLANTWITAGWAELVKPKLGRPPKAEVERATAVPDEKRTLGRPKAAEK